MGGVINKEAYINFNASFGMFVEDPAVKDGTIVKVDTFSLTGVKTLKAGEGDFKGNLFRNAAQIASNNRAREMFKKAVADIFGGEDKIPDSVKAAMKWNDFDGTGRPLTARRISATWAQIKVEERCNRIRNALNAQDWFGESDISDDVKTAFGSYIKQLSGEMTQAMEKLLLPSIQKGKAPSVENMKAFLKQFQQDSKAARTILDAVKSSLGNFDTEPTNIDGKARQRIIDVNNATPMARSAAFVLALAKNTDFANVFFDTRNVSNQTFKNFDQAYNEIIEDYRQREADSLWDGKKVRPGEGDEIKSNIDPLHRMAGPTRAYYIMGMSTEDAVEELMRLSKDEAQKESWNQGKVLLRDVVVGLECTPGSKARDILAGFFKKVGKQIVDGTIREKGTRGVDPFYEVIGTNLKNFMMKCMANRELNAAKGTTGKQPEWVLGSKEQDLALLEKLDRMFNGPFISKSLMKNVADSVADQLACDAVTPGLENRKSAKGKFLSLGNGVKISSEKPTPEENKATRYALIKLLDEQGESSNGLAGGPKQVISAAKMILAHDLTKEITHDEAVDLLGSVLKSRQNSPMVRQECEKMKNTQEKITESILESLEKVSEDYDIDLASRNKKNNTNLISKILQGHVFDVIKSQSPRVLQLNEDGVDVLGMVEKWGKARQRPELKEEVAKIEKELEEHGIRPRDLTGAFPLYKDRMQDPVSVDKTVQFWKSTLNTYNHQVELLNEDATQLGTWYAQKKMADELLGKYLPSDVKGLKNYQEAYDFISGLSNKDNVDWGKEKDKYNGDNPAIKGMLTRFAEEDEESIDDSVRRELSNLNDLMVSIVSPNETMSVIENMNTISAMEMEIRNNNNKMSDLRSKIRDLQREMESSSSPSATEELKNHQEAYDFISGLSDKDNVDWGKEKDEYNGDNQVIRGMLTRFAEEDEESIDDSVRRELSTLNDLIDSMSDLLPGLDKKQGELKDELKGLTERNAALNKDLTERNARLKDRMGAWLSKGLDRRDVYRQNLVQKEFLSVQNDNMKYQKYGDMGKWKN